MLNRKFMIPVAACISLTTMGCEDPSIGDWDIIEASGYPLPYRISYDSTFYSAEIVISDKGMDIDANFGGSLRLGVSVEYDYFGYTYSYSYTETFDVDVTVLKKKADYKIELTDRDGDRLNLTCAMSNKSLLECEDDDGDDWEFEKAL